MSNQSWRAGGQCRTVCRPVRKAPQTYKAAAVGRIARYAVDDGAPIGDICDALQQNGIDCTGLEGECERVKADLSRVQRELESASSMLEAQGESDLADAIAEIALAAVGVGGIYKLFGSVFRAWKLRNAAAETKRILEQLSRTSQEVETSVVKHSTDVVEAMKSFHVEP